MRRTPISRAVLALGMSLGLLLFLVTGFQPTPAWAQNRSCQFTLHHPNPEYATGVRVHDSSRNNKIVGTGFVSRPGDSITIVTTPDIDIDGRGYLWLAFSTEDNPANIRPPEGRKYYCGSTIRMVGPRRSNQLSSSISKIPEPQHTVGTTRPQAQSGNAAAKSSEPKTSSNGTTSRSDDDGIALVAIIVIVSLIIMLANGNKNKQEQAIQSAQSQVEEVMAQHRARQAEIEREHWRRMQEEVDRNWQGR